LVVAVISVCPRASYNPAFGNDSQRRRKEMKFNEGRTRKGGPKNLR
jgi:hypothetical protein